MPRREKTGFGERLAEARALRGFTQRQLGDAVGATMQSICRYEGEVTTPSIDMIRRLCRALAVSGDFLLGLAPSADGMARKAKAFDEIARIVGRAGK